MGTLMYGIFPAIDTLGTFRLERVLASRSLGYPDYSAPEGQYFGYHTGSFKEWAPEISPSFHQFISSEPLVPGILHPCTQYRGYQCRSVRVSVSEHPDILKSFGCRMGTL